ncbi:MAG: acetyl-CoA carboxylase carboxyl transferase subunit beta [Rickettsiales bacterium]|nr:acetyl-CoA carboxylase carboxyl transferase subunit beta [Rickettsiales bacterium]OUV80973.1 MAG: acetyl-CoA carboxylase, carboxyltransferase subunit beta [Rickettsiales bacterium TMED131]
MNWLTNFVKPKLKAIKSKILKKDNLWQKCSSCGQMMFHKDLEERLYICSNCEAHLPMPIKERLKNLYDNQEFDIKEMPNVIEDPLLFKDKIKYTERLKLARKKTLDNDAIIVASGKVNNINLITAAMNFSFMGGSMGMQVGEGIVTAANVARTSRCPLLIIASSGGARMQEGILSLMQMPRTVAAIEIFKETKLPYIVLFTNPVTGGVSASFTMLGDILIAEPGALIGFAGPRVIKKTVNEELPEGFQKSEYLLENGMIDLILNRNEFKSRLTRILKHLMDQ